VTAAPATSSESAFGLEVRRPGYCAAAERRGWRSSAASRSPSRRSVSSDSPRRGRRPAGVRAAVSFGPSPPQPGFFGDELARAAVSDDWLTVNVWSPDPGPGTGLPVLVWIPGGASVIGASSLPEFDGGRLAAGGVVVVTLNYRLGIEGFAQIECGPRPPACLPLTPGGCPARPWPSPGRSTGGRTAGHRP
jgi:acetyl esterase/lipase